MKKILMITLIFVLLSFVVLAEPTAVRTVDGDTVTVSLKSLVSNSGELVEILSGGVTLTGDTPSGCSFLESNTKLKCTVQTEDDTTIVYHISGSGTFSGTYSYFLPPNTIETINVETADAGTPPPVPCTSASWDQTTTWGPCSVTCGTGTHTRVAVKLAGFEDCTGTDGKPDELGSCQMPACPDACTPSCPSSTTICSGVVDTSPNGCDGTCNVVGTQDCSPGCDSPKVIIDGACKDVVVVDSLDDKTNLQNIYDIIKQGGNKLAQITGIASILKSIFG